MTDLQWQQRAAREVGNQSQNAVFELSLPFGVTGGELSIMVSGDASDPIAFNASALEVETAICLLPAVGENGAKVSGMRKGPYVIEIIGANAGQFVPDGWLLADGTTLEPPAILAPVLLQNGATTSLQSDAATAWGNYSSTLSEYERFLRVKDELLTAQMALYSGLVDQVDGDAQSKDSQRFAQLRQMYRDNKAELDAIVTQANTQAGAQTYTGLIARGVAVRANFALSRYPRGRC